MTVSAIDFRRLPRVTRAEVVLARRAARSLPLDRLPDASAALAVALGAEASLRTLPLETCPPGALASCLAEPLVAVLLRDAARARGAMVALELDPRLAECLADRALGGTAGASVGHRMAELDPTTCGVLAHVVARCVAPLGGTLRVADVVTTRAALTAAIGDDGNVVWPALLRVGEDEGVVRAWIPDARLARVAAKTAAPHVRALRVVLVVEVGAASVPDVQASALARGDVLILDSATVRPDRSGTATLRAAGTGGASRTLFRCALADGTLRVTGIERSEEPAMTEGERKETVTDAGEAGVALVGDAPLDVRVELARFSLSVEEIAALRPGEVVATGRTLGETVTLRAGERAIATGELVDVDGELGVRILRLGA